MNQERRQLLTEGLKELPDLPGMDLEGRIGESLATDEAAVWKRVINYRLARHLQPRVILETHPGLGISTVLYRHAAPEAKIVTNVDYPHGTSSVDLIDIDPFGKPWTYIDDSIQLLSSGGVLQISNGEAVAVRRNLKQAQEFPTQLYGKQLPRWVLNEYLPRAERITKLHVQYFYAFPTTIRAILSDREVPKYIWRGCRQWMWWLGRYAKHC